MTGVSEIDSKIGGLSYGSLNVVLGYTGQFKSLWLLNMAYNNTYNLGYNVCFISLEVSKRDILWNLLSRHSYDSREKYLSLSLIPIKR